MTKDKNVYCVWCGDVIAKPINPEDITRKVKSEKGESSQYDLCEKHKHKTEQEIKELIYG